MSGALSIRYMAYKTTIRPGDSFRHVIRLGSCTGLLACVLVVVAVTPTKSDYDGNGPRYTKQEIRRAIDYYAKQYRLDPALLRAVIKAESDFRQHAVSRKGAVGLMQLTPGAAKTLRVTNPYDSIQNIRGGAKQLRHLLNLYRGDLPLALAAYNAGVHRVKDHRVPRIRETRSYVRKVLRYYHAFRAVPHPHHRTHEKSRRPPNRKAA